MNLELELNRPFDPRLIKWRVGSTNGDKSKGSALAYIDARTVMRRLDAVFGLDGWSDSYVELSGRVVCTISCNVAAPGQPERWVGKSDGAGDTDIEGEKGGMSDAFKRAAVKWGIGRYLYELPSVWVALENRRLKETPPLPAWAMPDHPRWNPPKEAAA